VPDDETDRVAAYGGNCKRPAVLKANMIRAICSA
jgi:hypothetical protein